MSAGQRADTACIKQELQILPFDSNSDYSAIGSSNVTKSVA